MSVFVFMSQLVFFFAHFAFHKYWLIFDDIVWFVVVVSLQVDLVFTSLPSIVVMAVYITNTRKSAVLSCFSCTSFPSLQFSIAVMESSYNSQQFFDNSSKFLSLNLYSYIWLKLNSPTLKLFPLLIVL